jgi:uncharacterized delta-60 repeat protein/uncharacterized repeat protein (TIGR01451 family)
MVAVLATVASMVVFWPAATAVQAAQGDLDPTFDKTGQAITDMSGQFARTFGMAAQPDGKMVVVGMAAPADDPGRAGDMIVARFNADGTLDTSFNTTGFIALDVYGDRDEAHGVAVQPDGKILVAGFAEGQTPSRDIVVLRFNPDGTVDNQFAGGAGRFVYDSGEDDEAYALVLQADGKIVIGGRTEFSEMVMRLTADGELDDNFNDGVSIVRPFRGQRVNALAIDSKQRILAAGDSYGNFETFRLTPEGSLDSNFGGEFSNGVILQDFNEHSDSASSIAIASGDAILVAGSSNDQLAVVRYNAEGNVDDSFGTQLTDLGQGRAAATGVQALGNDALLAATVGVNGDVALARLSIEGEPVPDFGTEGVVVADIAGGLDRAGPMARLQDGKVLVAATAQTGLGTDLAGVRFNADGTVDTGYGKNGRTSANIKSAGDELTAMFVDDRDQSTTVVGYSGTGNGWDFMAARYDDSGFPMFDFGDRGKITLDLGGDDKAYAVARSPLQPGLVTIAGQTTGPDGPEFAVVRLSDFGIAGEGSLDTSFGNGGIVRLTVPNLPSGAATAVAVDSPGRTYVAGVNGNYVTVARLSSDGTIDTTFGTEGFSSQFINAFNPRVSSILLPPGGGVIVVGDVGPFMGSAFSRQGSFFGSSLGTPALTAAATGPFPGDRNVMLIRLGDDGAPNQDFGFQGVSIQDLSNGNDEAKSAVLEPNGDILVAGQVFPTFFDPSGTVDTPLPTPTTTTTTTEPPPPTEQPPFIGSSMAAADEGQTGDLVVAQFSLNNGQLNSGFGQDGGVTITDLNEGGRDAALAIVLGGSLPGADFYIAGQTSDGPTGDTDSMELNYSANGIPQLGTLFTQDLGGNDQLRAVATGSNGRVVVGGVTSQPLDTRMTLARLDDDGRFDTSFSDDGLVLDTVAGDLDEARGVALQEDGKVVVAGESRAGAAGDFAVARYNADGTLDDSFGRGGRVVTDVSDGSDGGYAVIVDPDGKIVVAGVQRRHGNMDFAVLRYNPDGSLDRTFGALDPQTEGSRTGIATINFAADDQAFAIVRQKDGKYIVGGSTDSGGIEVDPFHDAALARLNQNGILDPTFGLRGKLTTDNGGNSDEIHALALQPDGNLVAAGVSELEGLPQLWLARYLATADGNLDPGFGQAGQVTEAASFTTGQGVAVQPDGNIVVVGQGQPNADNQDVPGAFVTRYTPTGEHDNSFATEGTQAIPYGPQERGAAVALQPDGGIVTVGDSAGDGTANGSSLVDVGVARLRTDGVLDPRFGTAGIAHGGQNGGLADEGASVALQPDGMILVAGRALPDPKSLIEADFTVLRFQGGEAGPVVPDTDLSVTLTSSDDTRGPRVGRPVRLGITVHNNGPNTANGVVVENALPPGLTLIGTTSSQGSPCTVEGGTVRCVLGSIATGGTAGVTITVQPTAPGTVTDTVTVSSDAADPDRSNDSASVTLTVLPQGSIRVNPGVVQLGRVTSVIGTGFVPESDVQLSFAGVPQRTVHVDGAGNFVAAIVVFKETTPGTRAVEASDSGGVLATTNALVVIKSLAPPNFVGRN